MESVDLVKHLEQMIEHQNSLLDEWEADGNQYLPGIPYTTGYLHALEHIKALLVPEDDDILEN